MRWDGPRCIQLKKPVEANLIPEHFGEQLRSHFNSAGHSLSYSIPKPDVHRLKPTQEQLEMGVLGLGLFRLSRNAIFQPGRTPWQVDKPWFINKHIFRTLGEGRGVARVAGARKGKGRGIPPPSRCPCAQARAWFHLPLLTPATQARRGANYWKRGRERQVSFRSFLTPRGYGRIQGETMQ